MRPTAPRDRFAGYRVEHRPPDGPPRLLAETTSWTAARDAAKSWLGVLGRQGRRGDVAVVDTAAGEALSARAIDPARAPAAKLLSPRQAEVLTLLCAGFANGEVADRLGVSLGTVHTVRTRIRRNLGVASIAEACARNADSTVADRSRTL